VKGLFNEQAFSSRKWIGRYLLVDMLTPMQAGQAALRDLLTGGWKAYWASFPITPEQPVPTGCSNRVLRAWPFAHHRWIRLAPRSKGQCQQCWRNLVN